MQVVGQDGAVATSKSNTVATANTSSSLDSTRVEGPLNTAQKKLANIIHHEQLKSRGANQFGSDSWDSTKHKMLNLADTSNLFSSSERSALTNYLNSDQARMNWVKGKAATLLSSEKSYTVSSNSVGEKRRILDIAEKSGCFEEKDLTLLRSHLNSEEAVCSYLGNKLAVIAQQSGILSTALLNGIKTGESFQDWAYVKAELQTMALKSNLFDAMEMLILRKMLGSASTPDSFNNIQAANEIDRTDAQLQTQLRAKLPNWSKPIEIKFK